MGGTAAVSGSEVGRLEVVGLSAVLVFHVQVELV